MRPRDRSDRCNQYTGLSQSPLVSGDLSNDSQKALVESIRKSVGELSCFQSLASSILRGIVNDMTDLSWGPTNRTWKNHELEVKKLFTSLRPTLAAVTELNTTNDSSYADIHKKLQLSPILARHIEGHVVAAYELAETLLTATRASLRSRAEMRGQSWDERYDRNYEADLARVANRKDAAGIALRLFCDRDNNNSPLSILDLLAGCSFPGFLVTQDENALGANRVPQSRQIGMRSQSAALGVATARSCVRETFERLFEICLRSTLLPEVNAAAPHGCATRETVRIFEGMCHGSSNEHIRALHAIAADAKPLRMYEVDSGAVISFLLPPICGVFEEPIRQSLSEVLASALDTFEPLHMTATTFIDTKQGWREFGVRLQVPSESGFTEVQKETHALVQRLSPEADEVDPGDLSFWIQDAGSTCNHGVQAVIPRSFFDSVVSGGRLEPNGRLSLISETLQQAQKLFGDGAEVLFQLDRDPENSLFPNDQVYVIRDKVPYRIPQPDIGLSTVSLVAEFLSTSARDPLPSFGSGSMVTFLSPADAMKSDSVVDELRRLLGSVAVNGINIFDFQAHEVDGIPDDGSVMLRKLRETIELSAELLAPFRGLQLTVLFGRKTSEGARVIPFYLTTEPAKLCGIGHLSLDGDDPDLTVFQPSVVEKFAALVDAIMDSQVALQSQSGAWENLLDTELIKRNFGLSGRIVQRLGQHRYDQGSDLPIEVVTRALYEEIATKANFEISDRLSLKDGAPFTLAILTAHDRLVWKVKQH